jgi:prophage antirepressor-like protein
MDIIKAFNANDLHTEIVIKGTMAEPLFRASDVGVILDISNIRMSINDFDDSEKRAINAVDGTGRLQDITFLTEKGLYKVLFRSRKPIAQKFQNWVCEVIKEIRLHGMYDLKKEMEKKNDEIQQLEDKHKQDIEQQKITEREKVLLKEYASIGSIVYVIRVKTLDDGKYIVKIGESRKGITGRYTEHKKNYEECTLLDCFAVVRSKDFEHFIHHHELVRLNKVTDLQTHENENELFLIGQNLTYDRLNHLMTSNAKHFNNDDIAKMELENEKLKLLLEMNKTDNPNGIVQELMKMVQHLSSQMERFEKTNKELCEKINATQNKTTTGFNEPLVTLGPRLQKINPDTMQLIRVYESASEAMKENHDIKRPSLNKAVVENTVYHGYRWAFVDRELDANVIHNLPPTKKTKQQNLGYVAQLNETKTEICNVYIDRKTAAHFNGYESASALDNPVKQFTMTRGFYYKLYDQCDEALQHDFEHKINGKPLLYKNGVHQCDLQNVVVREFECKYDCMKALSMSDKTLTKALTKGIQYNGHIFKEAGSKLKIGDLPGGQSPPHPSFGV